VSSALKRPISLSQVAVPTKVCYIVPNDAAPEMLAAIFEECHGRWGGKDTLIIPIIGGHIDKKYWDWARDIDPDVIYSYVALDVPMLERIDRDLMPSVVTVHRSIMDPPDLRPRHEHEAQGLPALSLLPMLANADRLGPPGRLVLVSAFPDWTGDSFVTDSFGINPYGPGWAQAEIVRKYVETLAIGSRTGAQRGQIADREATTTTELLRAMSARADTTLTMAQLCGTGYEDVFHGLASSWRSFNIIVGDTSQDRIAFWNSRVGADDYHRRQIMAVRVGEMHLDDADFMSALVQFISRWIPRGNGQAFAAVRSSSIADDRLQPIADALIRSNVLATVSHFGDVNECAPGASNKQGFIRPGLDQRYTESKVPIVPLQPRHLSGWGPIPTWLSNGSWTVQIALKRENASVLGSIPRLPIPRRWQAVQVIAERSPAKATFEGDLRIVVRGNQKPETLSFFDDDAEFVMRLFLPHHYRTTMDPRIAIPQPAPIRPQTSSAGRHLRGLLNKLGSIRAASTILEDPFWKKVFLDMAVPREVFDDTKRAELAARLQKPIRRDGPFALTADAEFESLAETVAQIAPDLKMPVAKRNYEWFLRIYRETDSRPRDAALTPEEIERDIRQEVEEQLRWRCAEGVLIQGHDWRCPRCLHRNWSTVGALGAILTCEVCNRQEPVSAHFSWDFLLDSYIAPGLRERGLRGLVWALGTLSWSARDSFVFSPPLDLIQNDKLLTDSDIACVVDSKFVVGEVKESERKINDALGDRLIEVARAVHPDIVVLACLDAASLATVTRQTDRIREAVKDLGIDVMPIVPNPQEPGIPGMIAVRGIWIQQPTPVSTASVEPASEVVPESSSYVPNGNVEST